MAPNRAGRAEGSANLGSDPNSPEQSSLRVTLGLSHKELGIWNEYRRFVFTKACATCSMLIPISGKRRSWIRYRRCCCKRCRVCLLRLELVHGRIGLGDPEFGAVHGGVGQGDAEAHAGAYQPRVLGRQKRESAARTLHKFQRFVGVCEWQ